MGNAPFRFGSHLNLEDIPSFRQPFFDFTSHVINEFSTPDVVARLRRATTSGVENSYSFF